MKPSRKIATLAKDLYKMGIPSDDPAMNALELKQQYCEMAEEFERVREFKSYEVALEYVSGRFHVSKSTVKRALAFFKRMVQESGLK